MFFPDERVCPVCKKTFISPATSIYKMSVKKGSREILIYLCSYTCYRKCGGDSGKKEFDLKEWINNG